MTPGEAAAQKAREDRRHHLSRAILILHLALLVRDLILTGRNERHGQIEREAISAMDVGTQAAAPHEESPLTSHGGSHQLGPHDIVDRFAAQRATHHIDLFNVMKGVTLAAAGFACISIVLIDFSPPRILLLAVALVGALLAYYGATVGAPLGNIRPTAFDIGLPLLLTLSELVLIAWTAARPIENVDMPRDWLLALAAWQLCAGAMVLGIALRLRPSAYVDLLHDAIRGYRRRLSIDAVCALSTSAASATFWLLRHEGLPSMGTADYLFLIITLITYVGAISHQGRTSREIECYVRRLAAKDRPIHQQANPYALT